MYVCMKVVQATMYSGKSRPPQVWYIYCVYHDGWKKEEEEEEVSVGVDRSGGGGNFAFEKVLFFPRSLVLPVFDHSIWEMEPCQKMPNKLFLPLLSLFLFPRLYLCTWQLLAGFLTFSPLTGPTPHCNTIKHLSLPQRERDREERRKSPLLPQLPFCGDKKQGQKRLRGFMPLHHGKKKKAYTCE